MCAPVKGWRFLYIHSAPNTRLISALRGNSKAPGTADALLACATDALRPGTADALLACAADALRPGTTDAL
jgi:hypothetical protein